MNNDMKWEAVDHDQLTIGQQVRVRPTDGKTWLEGQVDHITAFHGARIALEGTATTVHTDGRWDVERAVPERTLPTEPGRYIAASMADSPHMANIMTLRGDGLWDDESTAAKIEPLVRLVPVTEVEEAEKRGIRKAVESLDYKWPTTQRLIRQSFPEAFEGATDV